MEYINKNFAHQDLSGVAFGSNWFYNCDFSFAKLAGFQINDSKLENCSFRSAEMTSAQAINTEFIDVDLSHANLNNAKLTGSEFTRVVFENCLYTCADFRESVYIDSEFLSNQSFGGVLYQNADLAGLTGVSDNWWVLAEHIKGISKGRNGLNLFAGYLESTFFSRDWQHALYLLYAELSPSEIRDVSKLLSTSHDPYTWFRYRFEMAKRASLLDRYKTDFDGWPRNWQSKLAGLPLAVCGHAGIVSKKGIFIPEGLGGEWEKCANQDVVWRGFITSLVM